MDGLLNCLIVCLTFAQSGIWKYNFLVWKIDLAKRQFFLFRRNNMWVGQKWSGSTFLRNVLCFPILWCTWRSDGTPVGFFFAVLPTSCAYGTMQEAAD